MSSSVEFDAERHIKAQTCHETALNKAVGADFWLKINSGTSTIDLDRFHPDLDCPKIQKSDQPTSQGIDQKFAPCTPPPPLDKKHLDKKRDSRSAGIFLDFRVVQIAPKPV